MLMDVTEAGRNNDVDIEGLATEILKQTENITKEYDIVNNPSHYTDSKIEVIDYIEDKNLGFCLGNVVKYISRAGKKMDSDKSVREKEIEDLKKARWYLDRRIFELESGVE